MEPATPTPNTSKSAPSKKSNQAGRFMEYSLSSSALQPLMVRPALFSAVKMLLKNIIWKRKQSKLSPLPSPLMAKKHGTTT